MIDDLDKYYSRKEMMEAAAAGEEFRFETDTLIDVEAQSEVKIGDLFTIPAIELPPRRRYRVRSSAII